MASDENQIRDMNIIPQEQRSQVYHLEFTTAEV